MHDLVLAAKQGDVNWSFAGMTSLVLEELDVHHVRLGKLHSNTLAHWPLPTHSTQSIIGLAPEEWLVIGSEALRESMIVGAIVTDITDRLCILRVSRTDLNLSLLTGLTAEALCSERCARTRMAGIPFTMQMFEDDMRLIFDHPYIKHVANWLAHAK